MRRSGPGILRTADSLVSILLNDVESAMCSIVPQGKGLGFRRLSVVLRRNPHIKGCAFHSDGFAYGSIEQLAESNLFGRLCVSHDDLISGCLVRLRSVLVTPGGAA
jgi:hypothetical protein